MTGTWPPTSAPMSRTWTASRWGDIEPGGPLEVALAEQRWVPSFGGNHGETVVVNEDEIVWHTERAPGNIPDTAGCNDEKDPPTLDAVRAALPEAAW